MKKALFNPQPGYRFYFQEHPNYIFEIGSITHTTIRYAAIAGGKAFSIGLNDFENQYKAGEILCVFAPEKLILNPKYSTEIHRKERYIISALQKLKHPTCIKQLSLLIQKIAIEIKDRTPPSPRTVARWIFKYRSYSQNKLCLKNEYKGNCSLRFPPEVYQILNQAINDVYLKPEYRTSKDVQAYMLGRFMEQGISLDNLPSLRSIQKHIKKLDPYLTLKIKQGSRIAKKAFQAAGQNIISPFALYMVEIDTHYLDIIVIDPKTNVALGRPFLACAIDVYSRAIVGTYINMYPPSAATTLAVIKEMVTRPTLGLPGGIPSIIIPDNGVEFKNNSLARVCDQLKITLTPSQVGTPNNKPHIERFFNTLTHGILQKLPGTTFSDSIERGSYNSTKLAQLTIEQLKKYINTWINEVYHRSIHSSTGRSPCVMWQDAIEDIKPSFLTETDAEILCRKPIERNINHGQVRIDGISYFSHALTTLQAQGIKKVTVLIDDLNLNEVFIIDPTNKNIIIQADSTNQDYTFGLTRVTHLEVQKIKKAQSRSDKQKIGAMSDLYYLYKLMHEIQSNLVRRKPRLKPLTLELPKQLERVEEQLLSKEEDIAEQPVSTINEPTPINQFGSLEVVKHGKI
ncbi:DDE-type integrase/transposase/recombinase [Acinetobacter schindleri]|jgi:transposase InsO family protein|uniref:Mu transposase C-terminal domain-containing protein n=1 Tax=Acinetobacter TaxID=469 RepID=UPI0002D60381|nr:MULTISPECIES: Mu transposase C-terminal domain-containing protein [Acinetobacter]KMU98869.1 transposase [Acinetobacter sp. VT 511]MDP1446073.1 DDE-type integrase/transposase/recombinase [Acinetobacter schindleri]